MKRHNYPYLILFTVCLTSVSANVCNSNFNLYPVYAGGSGSEYVNCMVHDERNELIIVGGNTTSTDFGLFDPDSADSSGFLYALDYMGNWIWGIQFSNLTNSVADITGCHMSSDGRQLSLLARSDKSIPTVIVIETLNG